MIIVLLAIVSGAGSAIAQSRWLEPQAGKGIALEFLPPAFKDAEFSTFTRTLYLSTRLATTEKARFVFEVPFAYYGVKDGDESDQAFGNIYLGGEIGRRGSGFMFEFGVRVPTAPEHNDAILVGAFSDYVDRFEAFVPEIFTGVVAGRYRYLAESGFALDLRLAPVIWFDTSGERSDGTEAWLLCAIQAGVDLEKVAIGGGYSNRILLSEDDTDLSERLFEQLVFFVNFRFDSWRPGLQFRVPLDDDLNEFLEPTIGLSIGYDFG